MRKAVKVLLGAMALAIIPRAADAQQPILARLQEKLDRQEVQRKGLVYSYSSETLVHRLDKRGAIEKTDTIRAWQKFRGDSLLEYKLLYSTDKKDDKGKEEKREGSRFPKLTDSTYSFQVDQESGRVVFSPQKAKKGDLAGELLYDPQSLDLRQIKANMPRLKWPINEFQMEMKFMEEGGYLFPDEFKMQVGWNALVSQGRIRVENRNSEFKIY